MNRKNVSLYSLVVAAALAVSSTAQAYESVNSDGSFLDNNRHGRPYTATFFVGVPYRFAGYGFPVGLSARFTIPVLPDGFIPPINDSFSIDVGADWAYFNHRGVNTGFFAVPVEAFWQFHIVPRWAVGLKLGAALETNFGEFYYDDGRPRPAWSFGVSPIAALSTTVRLTELVILRAEIGYPWAKLGIGFLF